MERSDIRGVFMKHETALRNIVHQHVTAAIAQVCEFGIEHPRKSDGDDAAERGRRLLEEFSREARKCRRTAATWLAKAEELLLEHESEEECDEYQTYGDVARHHENTAESWDRRALRIESHAGVIRALLDLIEANNA